MAYHTQYGQDRTLVRTLGQSGVFAMGMGVRILIGAVGMGAKLIGLAGAQIVDVFWKERGG